MCRHAFLRCLLLPCLVALAAGCQSLNPWSRPGPENAGEAEMAAVGKGRKPDKEARGPGRLDREVVQASAAGVGKDAGKSEGPILPPPTPEKGGPAAKPPAKPGVTPSTPPAETPPPPTAFAAGMLDNPHQRATPTVTGSILQMPPHESPIEKALELSAKVEALRHECARLAARLLALEDDVRSRDQALKGAAGEVQAATAEVSLTREQLRSWAEELKAQEAKLRLQEQSHQEQMRAVIRTLEKAADVGPAEASPKPAPSPAPHH